VAVAPDPCFVDPITRIKSCYLDKGSDDYNTAKSSCQGAGGYLVNIFTKAELDFINSKFSDDPWVGLTNDE
jgi:hypothetical protein